MAKVLTPSIMKIDEMVVAALKRKICPTKHAPDVGESAPLNPLSTPEVDSDLGKVSASRPTLVM